MKYIPGDVQVSGSFNGENFTFKADAIVSSVSFGVLKSDFISFKPDFPEWKRKALDEVGMGLMDKVYVAVPKTATWVPKERYFAIATEKHGNYPQWLNWGQTDTHYILYTFAIMEEGKRLEAASELTILDEVEQVFKSGFSTPNEPD